MTTVEIAESSSRVGLGAKVGRTFSDWRYMTKRNVLRLTRNPEKLFFNVLQTLMFVLLFASFSAVPSRPATSAMSISSCQG